jgi:hypothetical protein
VTMRTLPGAEKYLVSAAVKQATPTTWAERLIERADSEVSIFNVLEDFCGVHAPREGRSFKSRCPFADEHPDGGRLDKGFRTYPGSNSAMCFVMHGYMGPVRLAQLRFGVRPLVAAKKILDAYGLDRPRPWRVRLRETMIEAEQRATRPGTGDPTHAVEALHIALRKEPTYVTRQFDDDVLHAMEVVLDRLDVVMASGDPDAVRRWYDAAKSAMLRIVRREPR